MDSLVRFEVLGIGSASSHLLEWKNVRILIDCGWDERFDPSTIDNIARAVEQGIDAVILTHGDLAHAGALPHLISKRGMPLDIPIFFHATYVSKAFSRHPNWVQLRFLQHFHIQAGKMAGICLSPFNAGHALGGAIWKLILPDGSEILHAVDWCHRKERHLNGASLPDLPQRPFLVIASASGCLYPPVPSLKRDTELLEVVISTLRGDGSVLIPVDAAGRMLEVLILLEEFWAKEKMAYPLALVSVTGPRVIDSAQQQVEWMSDHIQHVFGTKRENPFALKYTKILTHIGHLSTLPQGPKIVLAFGPDLEYGPSRQLLFEWASDPKNSVCFIDRPREGSLADILQTHPSLSSPKDAEEGFSLDLQHSSRVPLQGVELEQYYSKIAEAAAALASDPMHVDPVALTSHVSGAAVKVLDPMEEDEEEDEERGEGAGVEVGLGPGGATAAPSSAATSSLGAAATTTPYLNDTNDQDDDQGAVSSMGHGARRNVLIDGFTPPSGSSFPMFPDEDEAMVQLWDPYGLVPGPDDSWACHDASSASTRSVKDKVDLEAEAEARRLKEEREEREEEERMAGPPSKVIHQQVTLLIKAALRFFDFGGRADGPIMKKALEDAAPQNLVIVRGTLNERRELSGHLASTLSDLQCRVIAWDHEGSSQAPLTFHLPPSQMLFISDDLDVKLMGEGGKGMQRMQRYALAQMEAVIGPPEPHHPKMLQLFPAALADTNGQDVFIVDSTSGIQLSLVKKALAEAGIEAVFQGAGTRLACGASGLVFVSRGGGEDRAHLVMEGTVSEEYAKVREVVYRQFSVGASVN